MLIRLVDSEKPIFLQIADAIEDRILDGGILEGEQVASTVEISAVNHINPATANKGVNLLVEQGILFKKRGIGMFVADGARELIRQKRTESFVKEHVQSFCEEAARLNLDKEQLLKMVERHLKKIDEKE